MSLIGVCARRLTAKRSPRTKMLRALITLQLENDTRRLRSMSMNRKKFYHEFMVRFGSRAGSPRLAHFAPKVWSEYFHGAAHFVKPRPHSRADAIRQRIFAYGNTLTARHTRRWLGTRHLINIVRGQDGDSPVVVTRVQHQPDDIQNPSRRF